MKLAEKFSVQVIDGKRKFTEKQFTYEYRYEDIVLDDGKKVRRKIEGSGHLVPHDVVTTGGFLVKFPNGNSIRIATEEQLNAMGFNAKGGLIDLDSGEDVPVNDDGSIDFRAMIATTAGSQLPAERQLDLLGESSEV